MINTNIVICVVTLILSCLSTVEASSQNDTRLALVMGNGNYDYGQLNNPVNDALLMAKTLEKLNFKVILDTNITTKAQFTTTIRQFGNLRSEYDVAFVYYAGHGIQIGSENFLLPTKEVYESEFDVLDFGVSVQNILRYLNGVTDKVNILVLDACRNNPFEHRWTMTRSLEGGKALPKSRHRQDQSLHFRQKQVQQPRTVLEKIASIVKV